jgi:hypothetical protein
MPFYHHPSNGWVAREFRDDWDFIDILFESHINHI